MQTALHIEALAAELKREIVGGTIAGTEFYKKERAAYLFVKTARGAQALGMIFHPAGAGYFLVPASKVGVETKEKPWPIFDLTGGSILAASQPVLDRICYVTVQKDARRLILALEAIGPNGNLWLLDEQFGKLGTLRKRDFTPGERYEMPPLPDRLNPHEVNFDALKRAMVTQVATMPSLPLAVYIEKALIGFSRAMAREAMFRAGLSESSMEDLTDEGIGALVGAILDMTARFADASSGFLYVTGGGTEAYPFKLSSLDEQPEKFKTLSLAVMAAALRKQDVGEAVDEKKAALDIVRTAVKKVERRIQHIEKDIAEAADYERYRRLGELLQINFDKLKRGMTTIAVDDIYAEPQRRIDVPLEQALSPKDNVESYFKRHRKGREGLELLQRRRQISRAELDELRRMLEELEANFDSASEKYTAELNSLRPRTGGPTDKPQPRLPYRAYQLSTGLTIFVGREGEDNDRLTFDFAKPHELWFHTQQCPGSHVVIKYPNKSFEPSKAEIEETAGIAAHFSKAKNDSLVPVIYTERRYVRKPRNAKPGLVTVEREKSVMVAPRKPAGGG